MSRGIKKTKSKKRPEFCEETAADTYRYILIANRLSIQHMLENQIVKDVRARLFGVTT